MTYSAAPEHLEQCLHGQAAPCTCGCWFDLDVRELITKLKRGELWSGLSLYRNAVVFPGIVSALCDAPCGERCVLFRKGEQIHPITGASSRGIWSPGTNCFEPSRKAEDRCGDRGGGSGLPAPFAWPPRIFCPVV